MEITHNIQFSNPSTLLLGKPGTGKTAKFSTLIEGTDPRDSGMSFVDPVSFIEPSPVVADLLKKGRRS